MKRPEELSAFLNPAAAPRDALQEAASALDAINALMTGCEDLHLVGGRSLDGLCTLLGAIVHVMDVAAEVTSNEETPR